MRRYWPAPQHWKNETVFLVGGGPSLKGMDLTPIYGKKVITINNAFKLVPQPSIIFYSDTRWWRWHGAEIGPDYQGRIVSTSAAGANFVDPRVCRMGRDYGFVEGVRPLSDDPTLLSGPDGGYAAINLAYLLGASRIVLLGFDMGFVNGEAHWHEDHPIATPESNYTTLFAPKYPALVDALSKRRVEVIRCTPSRLDFIPEMPLEEAVKLPRHVRF